MVRVRVRVRVRYQTLKRLKGLRKTWPETLHLQLDNTTKDNKNRYCVPTD
jgi:hypothetical protein